MKQGREIKITILIVEDHEQTVAAMQSLLSRAFPDCELLVAGSAERALELCEIKAPQVVVMDIVLPGMDGMKATRQIKTRLPATFVVVHSSHDIEIYREESASAGASAFVAKTRTFSDLVPTISGLLSSSRAARIEGNG